MKLPFLGLKMMVKSGLEFILKLTEPLQSCCCLTQKYLPRMAEMAWQLSRYLWRGSVNFKINSRPLFTVIFKLKNDNFKTRDFSPLIVRVLAGVCRKIDRISDRNVRDYFGFVLIRSVKYHMISRLDVIISDRRQCSETQIHEALIVNTHYTSKQICK